jgi:hypothetical protein
MRQGLSNLPSPWWRYEVPAHMLLMHMGSDHSLHSLGCHEANQILCVLHLVTDMIVTTRLPTAFPADVVFLR